MTLVTLPDGWVVLRPITGHEERAVEAADLPNALALVDRLLVERPGALTGPGGAAALPSAARDRVLAGIYTQIYGDRVVSSPRCVSCGAQFDLSFALSNMVAAYPLMPAPPDGIYDLEAGATRFRLPTGEDELAVIGLPPQAARRDLLHRCIVAGSDDPALVEAAMERVAPILSVDISETCPECGGEQTGHFEIGAYLFARLLQDKTHLPEEVHALAVSYHWSLHNILSLSRVERRRYLALIQMDANRTRTRTAIGARRRIG